MNSRRQTRKSVLPKTLSRRTVLRGVGASLGLPLLNAMINPEASAQSTAGAPKRILLYYTGNGFPPRDWRCEVQDEVTPIEQVKLSHILSPLEPLKQYCTFIEGVPMNSGLHRPRVATAHAGGTAALFTGSYAKPGNQYGGGGENGVNGAGPPRQPSLENIIARAVGQKTRFPAYYLGVQVAGPVLLKSVFYDEMGQPVTPNADPHAVRDELFDANFHNAQSGTAQAKAQLTKQTAVLDAVLDSAQSIRCRLGMEDRARLDLHLTQVRQIESSLGALVGGNLACEAVEADGDLRANRVQQFPRLGRAQNDMIAMALTCDLTRVGGFFFTPALHNPTYTWLGHSEGHHNMTHNTGQYDQCADVNRWHAEELFYLVDKLAKTPEGNGSVLDNTLILWASECAQTYNGDPHDLENVGFAVIGGAQGYFKTGQYLKFPAGDRYSHNRLLVSLAQYMGVQTEAIGEAEYNTEGALPHLLA